MPFPDQLICEQCGSCWSSDPEDYPALRDEEYLICSCGALLCRKADLSDEEPSVLRPAP